MILPAAATHVRAHPPSTLDRATLGNLYEELRGWRAEFERTRDAMDPKTRAVWIDEFEDLRREVERDFELVRGAIALRLAESGLSRSTTGALEAVLRRAEGSCDGIYLGEVDSSHFEFVALGRSPGEARLALDAGLAAHTKHFPDVDPDWIYEVRRDFEPRLFRPGCYRDGEPLAILREIPPEIS